MATLSRLKIEAGRKSVVMRLANTRPLDSSGERPQEEKEDNNTLRDESRQLLINHPRGHLEKVKSAKSVVIRAQDKALCPGDSKTT